MVKIVGLIISIVIAWAVRLGSAWLANYFGGSVDPAQQANIVTIATGSILAAFIGAVEVFERLFWPRIKARFMARFDKKFPEKK
jgi:hypothetical protein